MSMVVSNGVGEGELSDVVDRRFAYNCLSISVRTLDDGGGNCQSSRMPRGNPKRKMILRIDPALADEVKSHLGDGYFTTAVEDGLRWWLKRAKRQAGVDPLAKHLAPPTARESALRGSGRET